MKVNSCKNSIVQINGETYINGEKIDVPNSMLFGNSIVQINGKTYINGREFKNGKWKLTLKGIINCLF